jgi:hypothetical protein
MIRHSRPVPYAGNLQENSAGQVPGKQLRATVPACPASSSLDHSS